MQYKTQHVSDRGVTLIDVVVGTAIMVFIFLAIFGAFRISIELIFSTKAKTGAVSLMTERMEYIRSLPYGSVGTVGGIPAGSIPQLEQTTLNGIQYTIRTLIQYTDATEDGLDTLDENAVTADYKTVKVEVLWSVKNSARSTHVVTRVSPPGIETLEDGGTLKVSVFDSGVNPLSGAVVRIVNAGTTPAIDVSANTNTNGVVSFPGAPGAGGYEITVTKGGHSTAQTYSATAENQNPSPAHVAVVDEQTTSISMFIDRVGSLRFKTFEPVVLASFADTFLNETKLSSTPNTEASAGALILEEESPAVYFSSGNARSQNISPLYIASWDEITFTRSTPAGTAMAIQLYYFNGAEYVLVPDEDLPNNSAGFSSSPVVISSLSPQTYSALQLSAFLTTSDSAVTPSLNDWELSYTTGPTPLPNVSFDIRGSKTIGANGATPVYKYEDSFTTNSSAEWFIDGVEWDTYTIALTSAYDIAERCPNDITISPAQALEPYFYLAPNTQNSLRVYVASGGTPMLGALVSVSGGVGSASSSNCGQTYFGGLVSANRTVTISKAGYQTHQETITISGDSELLVGLTPQ